MTKNEIVSTLSSYFQQKADTYGIDAAFLYGSWACGCPKEESDIDVAVVFNHEKSEDDIFDITNNIAVELTDALKKETNVLYIDAELSKPMLHYNAIVHGVPVFIRDFTRYVDLRLRAIHQMEDFNIFGMRWQSEITRKRMEAFNRA